MEPTQLMNQAETISALIAQRDKLIEEAEYNMAKLESEREEWLRTAEALVAANLGNWRSKGVKRDVSDVERQCAAYESDNKSLREKVCRGNARVHRRYNFDCLACSYSAAPEIPGSRASEATAVATHATVETRAGCQ